MRILVDDDPVIVLGRTAATGELTLEPWDPSMVPAHRRDEGHVHPFAVPLTGWPADPVDFDATNAKLVWCIEGTWQAGNTIACGSRQLQQDPVGRHYVMDGLDHSQLPRATPTSPFDDGQERELHRLRSDGAILATSVRRDGNCEKCWEITAFEPDEVSRSLALRPDQPACVVPAEWTADTVQRARESIQEGWDRWPVLSTGAGQAADGRPFTLTLRVAWLDPDLLQLYEETPAGLLDLDVWLHPVSDRPAA